MGLRTWQLALTFLGQATIACFCVYFLASPPDEASARTNGHRTFHLILLLLSAVSCGIMVWSVQKRQTFFMAIITTMGELLMTCDTMWKCWGIRFGYKILCIVAILTLAAVTRKLAGRLDQSQAATARRQFTPVQKASLCAFVVCAALIVVFPNFIPLPACELCAAAVTFFSGWYAKFSYVTSFLPSFTLFIASFLFLLASFLSSPFLSLLPSLPHPTPPQQPTPHHSPPSRLSRYSISSKKAFGALTQNSPGPGRVSANFASATRAKSNLQRQMLLSLVVMSIVFGLVVCLSSLWAANAIETCQERSRDDVAYGVEDTRFYTGDILLVVSVVLTWQTTIAFTAAARKKKAAKTKSAATAAAAAGTYANVSGQ
jgi:hypothetical protein